MANTVYDNFVLESKLKDLLTTKLDTKTLMTIDNSLTVFIISFTFIVFIKSPLIFKFYTLSYIYSIKKV